MKIIDMHCDTISVLLEKRRRGEMTCLRESTGHLDLQRMRQSRYLLQNFALYVNQKRCADPWDEVCALHEVYRQEIAANADMIAPVLRYEDIASNEAEGKMSAMLTVEEGAVCKGETERLRKLYDMGVRMLTLTWNFPNELGYPHCEGKVTRQSGEKSDCTRVEGDLRGVCGLTEKGREFVTEMQHLGMIVDVSHLSDSGFYDVLECTQKPFVASHSNARSICGHSRNLTDDMIRRLAERGGCTGLNFYVDFLEKVEEKDSLGTVKVKDSLGTVEVKDSLGTVEVKDSLGTVEVKDSRGTADASAFSEPLETKAAVRVQIGGLDAMIRHARHIVNVGGIEVLGLGSDFDGIDTNEALPGVQGMELLWNALKKAGFTEGQLDRIFYQNVLRVYRDCMK